MTSTQRESKRSSLPVSRPETKAQPKETLAGYYPLFDCCWGLGTRFQLPEGDVLKAAMFIPETREIVGIIEKENSIKFYCQRLKLGTSTPENSAVFNPDQIEYDAVNKRLLLMPDNQVPVYTLFRDEVHGDCVAVSDIGSYQINLWKLNGELIQVLKADGYGVVVDIARLNSHQLVSLHTSSYDPIKIWDLTTGNRLNSSISPGILGELSAQYVRKLSILRDGRIVISCYHLSYGIHETAVYTWHDNQLTKIAQLDNYYYLCEINNGLVVCNADKMCLLDSETLNPEAVYSALPKALTVYKGNSFFHDCLPIAIPQPNGCINLIAISQGEESISEIFSPTLEKMGEYIFIAGDIESACPFSNAPFAFYPLTGECLGHFTNYNSYYRKALLSTLESTKLLSVLHSIVMDDDIGTGTSLKTIPLADLAQFSKQLIACLKDEKKFPPFLKNPLAQFAGLFVSLPAYHASAKDNLINQVKDLLDNVKNPTTFELCLFEFINQFWIKLNEAASIRYKKSLAEFLQLKNLNQRSPNVETKQEDDFSGELTISLLRCLIASKTICCPANAASVSDEMKKAKGTKVFIIKTDIKTVSLPDEEAKETKDIVFYSKPVFTSADTFVRACGHFPVSFRALQSYQIVGGQVKALIKESLPEIKLASQFSCNDEFRYLPFGKEQGFLYVVKLTASTFQFIVLDSKKLTSEAGWKSFYLRGGLVPITSSIDTTKHGIRFSPSNQMVAVQIGGNQWLTGTNLIVYDYSSGNKAVIYLGEDQSQCYDFAICSEKPMAVAFLVRNLRGMSSKLALHIGKKIGHNNIFQYSPGTIPLPIEYDRKAERQHFRLIFWPGSAFFAVASTEQSKIWFLHLQTGWLGESVVLIKEFNGQLKRNQRAEYLLDDFLIFYDQDSNQVIGYNPSIDTIVQFAGLNPDCDEIVVSVKGIALLKEGQMTYMTSLPALGMEFLTDYIVNNVKECNRFSRDLVKLMAAYAGNGFFDVDNLPSSLSPACPIKENREVKFTPV